MTFSLTLKHCFFDFIRLIGMRDRLRCPKCAAVGTWKPHGGWLDGDDKRKVRRWMCKWCGYYVGPEGEKIVGLDSDKGCWTLEANYRPKENVKGNPWFG
jgi:allantoicase